MREIVYGPVPIALGALRSLWDSARRPCTAPLIPGRKADEFQTCLMCEAALAWDMKSLL